MKKILVVDDDKLMRKTLIGLLTKSNYEVIEAEDGKEAFEKLQEEKMDLLIVDILMPDVDGIEMVESLRANPNYNDLPIIVISGLKQEIDYFKTILTGHVVFIEKPFEAEYILEHVRKMIL